MAKPISIYTGFVGEIPATGAAGSTTYYPTQDGINLVCTSTLGLGVLRKATDTGLQLQFDAVAEAAYAAIYLPPIIDPSKPFHMQTKLRLSNIGDNAALDADWGLVSVIDATTLANLDDASMTSGARFHMDGNSANIMAQGSGGAAAIASTDTTIDNVTTAYKVFDISSGGDGVVRMYAAAAAVLSSTSFAISTTIPLGVLINIEKTSDDTLAVLVADYLYVNGTSI